MNRSLGIGLLAGLAVGLLGGALIARTRHREERPKNITIAPPPIPPAPLPAAAPKDPAPDPEIESLKTRLAEAEAKLLAEYAKRKSTPPPEEPAAEKPGWSEKLGALLKKGASAYKGKDFHEMVALLKEAGAPAITALADTLLKSESAGERFLAAALMEDLDDPAAIPHLAKALANDDDLLVRRMSSHAIALIENESGLPSLRTAMSADTDWGVRVNSAYGVAKLGQADGLKMLEEAYNSDKTPAEYKLAVYGGLADVASPSSAPVFRKVLAESTDVTYLYLTIGAVEKLKDASFVADLNRIAADSKYSGNVREMAKKAAESLSK